MHLRLLVASALGLLATAAGRAQDRPTELPPLLTPPTGKATPRTPAGPRGPSGEYDHSHLYLPDYVPPPPQPVPETCAPLGRWWVNPALELAWIPTRPAPGPVRLSIPNGRGGSLPGPILPIAGHAPDGFQGGFSLSVGRFLGDTHTHAVEGSLFTLGAPYCTFDAFAPGALVVFPGGTSRSSPQVIPLPPPLDTAIVGVFPATLSTWFIGADVNYRYTLVCNSSGRLDAMAGYRFAYLQDELFLGDAPDPGRGEFERNRIATANPFHGGQVGLAGEYRVEKWYVGGTAKVAFGVVASDVTATGLFTGAEGASANSFARLAALTDPHRTHFAVLPAASVMVGQQLRDHLRVFAGYSFQYLSQVTRLGDVLNAAAPATTATDFWVQSLNFGMELRY